MCNCCSSFIVGCEYCGLDPLLCYCGENDLYMGDSEGFPDEDLSDYEPDWIPPLDPPVKEEFRHPLVGVVIYPPTRKEVADIIQGVMDAIVR